MRPEALEIEGFTAFRQGARVEFGDAEMFAFTGPTGAGKSSLIDAMIFALYGRVPRLGERLVEPVITKGRQEARIRLDFGLGAKRYTAVRVVHRTSTGGATTKEARLESGGEVLAGNVKELNKRIDELIGLDFQQFTTCVALPQGEFARFLKQTASERQQLLSQLLGLDIYRQVRAKASNAQTAAAVRKQMFEAQLQGLVHATKTVLQASKKRLAALKRLQELAEAHLPELAKLRGNLNDAQDRKHAMETQGEALAAVRTPDAVAQIAKAEAAAEEHHDRAQDRLDKAERQVERAKERLSSLDDAVVLNELRTQHKSKDRLAGEVAEAKTAMEAAVGDAAKQRAVLAAAESAVQAAQAALDDAKHRHAAHALRMHLEVGEPCPVCEQDVARLPSCERPAALEALERALVEHQGQLDVARRHNAASGKTQGAADALWQSKQRELAELGAKLQDAPTLLEVEKGIADIEDATKQLELSGREQKDAKRAAEAAAETLKQAKSRERREWKGYKSAWDRLADLSLKPPMPSDHLPQAWADLETWAQARVPKLRQERETMAERAKTLEREGDALDASLAKEFAKHDVAYEDKPAINVATAVSEAKLHVKNTESQLEQKRECKKQAKAAQRRSDVAQALAGHLNARGFERWLLMAAFDQLVASASDILRELSNGQYTFQRNKFEFDVVDHANAGETRTAKTLSGGETFLASLALALALSEHIADLATHGAAQLESIFLDEGFGTLDGETLDTVATAIEELSTQGRMVGIVTHVADLADRIPVRFNVSKTAATAKVERTAQ